MRDFLTLFLIAFCCSIDSAAQVKFEDDTAYYSANLVGIRKIDSIYDLNQQYDFILRLQIISTFPRKFQYFILTFSCDRWNARLFHLNKDSIEEVGSVHTNFRKLWKSLKKRDILNIPSPYRLMDSLAKADDFGILDGISYNFDLSSPSAKRQYFYHCPTVYAERYPMFTQFVKVIEIIQVVYKFFGISDKIC